MGQMYRERFCSSFAANQNEWSAWKDTLLESSRCKGKLSATKREIVLASAFLYTHVLQDGSQYMDLYEISWSFTEMT